MDVFKNMQVFVAVAEANSFRRAGEALGLPSSTVSRRIAELERDVGLRLFNRTTRRVELTESGRRYFENCQRIVQEAELAHLELVQLQQEPSGLIRASIPVDFSVVYLSPILAAFSRRHPGIQFNLDLNPHRADLIGDPVDFVIRMGPPQDPSVIARPIAKVPTVLAASPDYLRQQGSPERPEDLSRHNCLRMREGPWTLTDEQGHSQVVNVSGAFIANNLGLLRQLALAGQGILQTSRAWLQADLDAGRLVRVLPGWSTPTAEAFALTTTRLLPAKVRLFLEFLSEQLTDDASNAQSARLLREK
jgi:DNA-binding transcriptional LysR family regulator